MNSHTRKRMTQNLLEIETRVAHTLAILDDFEEVRTSPFFTERVLCKWNRDQTPDPPSSDGFRYLGLGATLLLLLNLSTLFYHTTSRVDSEIPVSPTSQPAPEYGLNSTQWEVFQVFKVEEDSKSLPLPTPHSL